ncbi:hypothetical protein FRC01_011169, partial [Tulasnella sp. 417]
SSDEKIDVTSQLSKQIELVRAGSSQVLDLVRTVAELKTEVQGLRSVLEASRIVESPEGHPPLLTPQSEAVKDSASPPQIHELKADPSPKQHSGIVSIPLTPTSARSGSISGLAVNGSIPGPTTSVGSVIPLQPEFKPTEFFPVLPAPFQLPSVPTLPAVVPDSAHTPTPTTAVTTGTSSPFPPDMKKAPSVVTPKRENLEIALTDVAAEDGTCQSVSCLTDEGPSGGQIESEACAPEDEKKLKEGDIKNSEDVVVPNLHPKSSITAKVVISYYSSWEGEITIKKGDKLTILDSPDVPAGWMYGEAVETRRGIFLARHVKELSPSEVKDNDSDSGSPEVTERIPELPVIVVALFSYPMPESGELRFEQGDEITILDSPDTPVGWMYGEIIRKRRGIFPARYVRLNEDQPSGSGAV